MFDSRENELDYESEMAIEAWSFTCSHRRSCVSRPYIYAVSLPSSASHCHIEHQVFRPKGTRFLEKRLSDGFAKKHESRFDLVHNVVTKWTAL